MESECYILRFAREVYQKRFPQTERKFLTRHEFQQWVLETLGPRPSSDYQLFLTGNYDCPAEWRLIEDIKSIYQSYLEYETNKRAKD